MGYCKLDCPSGETQCCIRCTFYEHCPECFRGAPCAWNLNKEGEMNETEKGNTN